jgi:broad specificity phosphatase PhoE
MAEIEVDLVIVSPLRRALHTCDIIFKNHKCKPPIIVEPCFRELFYGSADVGSKLPESVQQYPYFNYDKVKDKEAWFVHTLQQKDREAILNKI